MKYYRIVALIYKYLYLVRHNLDRIFDIIYWPIMSLLVWGFTTVYLKDVTGSSQFISFFIGGLILWTLMLRSQQDISIFLLEDFWSRNIYNTFSSPLKNNEIFLATALFAAFRSLIALGILGVMAYLLYSFNILSFGVLGIVMLASNLIFFGSALGILVAGFIYRYGMEIQVFAWSIAFLFQPFSAVFYPREVLPGILHTVSLAIPTSHVFEGMRAALQNGIIPWSNLGVAFALNIIYLIVAYFTFSHFIERSRKTGFLARNA